MGGHQAAFGEIQDSFKVLEEINDKYLDSLVRSDCDGKYLDEANAYILECDRKRNEAHSLLVKK